MTRVRQPRAFLWLLLVAALFMRAFVPQGYMPARSDSGAVTVRVCGSGHVLQIPIGNDKAPRPNERAEPPCAFAGLGTPVLPPPGPDEWLAPATVEQLLDRAGGTAPIVAVRLAHQPARGPPVAA